MAFLTTTGLSGEAVLTFCVDTDDLTKTLAVIESDTCVNRPYDLFTDVSLLSLYPTKSRLEFISFSLLSFIPSHVNLLAASSSISALTLAMTRSQIPEAIESLSLYFDLPNRSSWLEECQRVKQIDAIKPD